MKKLILFFTIWLVILGVKAQVFDDPAFTNPARKALEHVYNLEFKEANTILNRLKITYKDHPAPFFLSAVSGWWQAYLSEQTAPNYEEIEELLDQSIEINDEYEDREDFELEYTYFKFMGYALKAKAHAAQGEWWKGVNAARKVISPLKAGFKFTERRPEFFFSSGIYHYYAATYADEYLIVKPFMVFFPNGDAKLGLEEMEKAAAVDNFAQVESMFYLGYIYLDEINQPKKGLAVTRKLAERFPKNTWFQADYAHALLINGQHSEAQVILQKLIDTYQQQPGANTQNITSQTSTYTTHLMLKVYHYFGKSMLFGEQAYQEAKGYLEKSFAMAKLAEVEEDNLLAEGMYYIGRCYDGLGMRAKAIEAYKEALDMDQNVYIKDEAKACIKTPCD